jgi:hypothetical protein
LRCSRRLCARLNVTSRLPSRGHKRAKQRDRAPEWAAIADNDGLGWRG